MLTRIELQHFKCFDLLKLPLSRLTLLSGTNASGKSSLLQALVLLHQTMRDQEWSTRLMLNGSAVQLGTVADVVDQVQGRRSFVITLLDADGSWYHWEFQGERDDMSMPVRRARGETASGEGWDADLSLPLRYLMPYAADSSLRANPASGGGPVRFTKSMRRLTYLTAERLGPREYYLLDDRQLAPVVGSRGEYAVGALHSRRDADVRKGLVAHGVPPTLFRQVEHRMDRFFPGCVLAIEQVARTNAVTLGIRVSNDTDFHRPIHAGFGLTQVFPIVVAALSASRDDLLLIENPEVHLHPAGQAAMGQFLAEVAAVGVQVILETHSDHVLNGIRRAVRNGTLTPGEASLHFFRPRQHSERDGLPQVHSPVVDSDGNIDAWPDGFFDQFDKDMNYFAGWD